MGTLENVRKVLTDRWITSAGAEPTDVLMFYPLFDEVDTLPLFGELKNAGCHVYFPVTHGDDMSFFEVGSLDGFMSGALKVMEPGDRKHPYVYGMRRTVCLTPGTYFSERRQRRGRGKGYYDRFFSEKPDIFKIGITTEAQVVPEMEVNPWDVDMDMVVTESRIIE